MLHLQLRCLPTLLSCFIITLHKLSFQLPNTTSVGNTLRFFRHELLLQVDDLMSLLLVGGIALFDLLLQFPNALLKLIIRDDLLADHYLRFFKMCSKEVGIVSSLCEGTILVRRYALSEAARTWQAIPEHPASAVVASTPEISPGSTLFC